MGRAVSGTSELEKGDFDQGAGAFRVYVGSVGGVVLEMEVDETGGANGAVHRRIHGEYLGRH